jgi:hypothetical protein
MASADVLQLDCAAVGTPQASRFAMALTRLLVSRTSHRRASYHRQRCNSLPLHGRWKRYILGKKVVSSSRLFYGILSSE